MGSRTDHVLVGIIGLLVGTIAVQVAKRKIVDLQASILIGETEMFLCEVAECDHL